MISNQWLRRLVVVGAIAVVCGLGAVAAQQTRDVDPTGSLSALTNEVRLLRQAVEKSSQTQSQVQAMAVYLSAQQNRLNQVAMRTDNLRKELRDISDQTAQIGMSMSMFGGAMSSGTAETRKETEGMVTHFKATLKGLAEREADVRMRLNEADAAVQNDLVRWTEMITRLEQLTK